jgi:2-dehydro-3-deoxyphosphogluconate aldolase/(4S)-4-hydroxy-2-oxoglutarate aldolase
VLDLESAKACLDAGAQFIVSPAFDEATVDHCRKHDIAVLPGALTPTEILRAWNAGADVVKIFPASATGGAKYLKSLKAPLPHIEMIPTGGVSLATAVEFLDAGAFALGVGADLVDTKAITDAHPETVTAHARKYLQILQTYRK